MHQVDCICVQCTGVCWCVRAEEAQVEHISVTPCVLKATLVFQFQLMNIESTEQRFRASHWDFKKPMFNLCSSHLPFFFFFSMFNPTPRGRAGDAVLR